MCASYTDVRILQFWFSRFLVLCLNSTVAEQKTTFFGWSRSWIFLYARLLFRHTSSCCSYSLKKKNIWHNWAHYYLFLIFHLNRMKIVIVIITAGVGSGITAGSGWELYTIQLVPAQGLQPDPAENYTAGAGSGITAWVSWRIWARAAQKKAWLPTALYRPFHCHEANPFLLEVLYTCSGDLGKTGFIILHKVALQTGKDTFWRTKKKSPHGTYCIYAKTSCTYCS